MEKNKFTKCYKKVNLAIQEIEKIIESNGYDGDYKYNLSQINKINKDLKQMSESLENKKISWSYIGFGNIIIDSWPLDSNLGDLLLDAEQEYKKLLI